MSWTDDRVSLLKKLWGEGCTAAEIAKELGGVTRNAVIGKAHRLKLSGRVSPIQQNNKKPVERKVAERVSVVQAGKVPALTEKLLKKPANSQLCSLLELKPRACRWPVGDPKDEHFGFCGENAMTGLPYCSDHAKQAYQAATRNRILKAETVVSEDDSNDGAKKKVS